MKPRVRVGDTVRTLPLYADAAQFVVGRVIHINRLGRGSLLLDSISFWCSLPLAEVLGR